MISTFTAFIDANVFYGARLRSLVLFVAQTKLFRARWSERIHDEWVWNLLENRPDLQPADLAATRAAMNASIPDCVVEGYEPLIKSIDLPDPDDRHVLAAAIVAHASVIVTFNEKDFPREILDVFQLHTKHPDEFLQDVFHLSPEQFVDAVRGDFSHYVAPPLAYKDYLASLAKAGVPQLAKELEAFEVLMPSNGRGR